MDPTRGFTPVEESTVHEWAMFSLVATTTRSPEGEIFGRTHVRSPGAVAVVAVTDADEVVLVEQWRSALGSVVTEIPAGMRDVPEEDPAETAARELAEETGLTASSWAFVGRIHSAPGVTDSEVLVFRAQVSGSVAPAPHGPEESHMTVLLLPWEEALRRVEQGLITDAKTVFGLLAVERSRRRGL